MTSSTSSMCWPSRFWLKWLAVFLGAIVAGMILAVVIGPKKPQPQQTRHTPVTASLEVYIRSGTSPAKSNRANLFFGTSPADISRKNTMHTPSERSQEGGAPIDFVVYPVDNKDKEMPWFHVLVTWPKEKDKKVMIILDQQTHQGSVVISQ